MDYAVVIGIDHYAKRPLEGAVKDAEAFKKWLQAKNNLADEQIELLVSEAGNTIVSGVEIDLAFDKICKTARQQEGPHRLYFYFSGHGIGMTYDNTGLCLRYWPGMFNHCISGLDYKTGFINKGIFSEILIFLDCCREHDTLVKANSPIGSWNIKVGDLTPAILICNSTAYGKLSYEYVENDPTVTTIDVPYNEKRGAFTSFLINALNGDADPGNGVITALDLKAHIEKNFETFAESKQKKQKAMADTQNGGDTIVVTRINQSSPNSNCMITFLRNTNVTLLGPTLDEIWTGNVNEGQVLPFKLRKGIHVLKDNQNAEVKDKMIINYSEKTVIHEQF